jgi:arsenate reductase (thioredoxin)
MHGKFSILFLCTWNAGRSIFAECFMKEFGAAKFDAFSAGVNPRGEVWPVTLQILKERYRIDPSDARSKSWHEFQDKELDFIVSVSDQAEETTPAFPGKPILAHWPFPDASQVQAPLRRSRALIFKWRRESAIACNCSTICLSISLTGFDLS